MAKAKSAPICNKHQIIKFKGLIGNYPRWICPRCVELAQTNISIKFCKKHNCNKTFLENGTKQICLECRKEREEKNKIKNNYIRICQKHNCEKRKICQNKKLNIFQYICDECRQEYLKNNKIN